jgi:hypothetical protein
VFEQGVADMRALLEDAVAAKDEAIEELDRLAMVQKKYSMTW